MSFSQVQPGFAVSAQLLEGDVARAAEAGFRTLINNRPDFEAPDQPTSAQIEKLCRAHGLGYVHAPTTAPTSPADVASMAKALNKASGPVLAYCRSGTRSITLWAMVQAQNGTDIGHLIEAARNAGYDIRGQAGALAGAQADGNHAKG